VFKSNPGKLMVYASKTSSPKRRLRSVTAATEKTAEQLNLDFEMVPQKRGCQQIYVYYGHGDDEPIPIYWDEGKKSGTQEIKARLRNMMFVLSFHPRHTALKQMRSTIMKLS
jgi:hypothetical protein